MQLHVPYQVISNFTTSKGFLNLSNLKMYGLLLPEFPSQHASWRILEIKSSYIIKLLWLRNTAISNPYVSIYKYIKQPRKHHISLSFDLLNVESFAKPCFLQCFTFTFILIKFNFILLTPNHLINFL